MSKYNCYLCASDEGILLDIFGDAGKSCRENIETCLSVKIKQSDTQSTKICHKCVYELDSCGKFVLNYGRSKDSKESRRGSKRGYCSLCGETEKKIHLLEVKKGISLKNLLHKIGQVFEDNLFKDKTDNLSICLDCRYNLDVLFDLKSIHQGTREKLKSVNKKDLKLSDLPKTRTSVVSRKTTYIPLPRLNGNPDYDSDANTSSAMSVKHKRGRPRKNSVGTTIAPRASSQFRSCEECNTQVEYGIDMYRYHRSGLTVCKDCWLTMDPEKMSNGKRKRFGRNDSEIGTKLCAVYLKDVLSNPTKYNSIYKIETDNHGNTTFLITDDSSENEDKTLSKRQRGRPSTSSVPSLETTALETRKTSKRLADTRKTDKEYEPPKKIKASLARVNEQPERLSSIVRTRTRNGLETDSTTGVRTRTRRGSAELVTKTEITVKETPETNSSKKPTGRKLGRPTKAMMMARKMSSDEKSQAGESSSNETKSLRNMRGKKTLAKCDTVGIVKLEKLQRTTKRTRSNSLTSQEAAMPLASRLSALSEDSTPSEHRNSESKRRASRNNLKNAKSDSELEKPYTCSVCRVGYKNKLIGKAHELTHEKQPEVKLQRVVIPEIIVEERPDRRGTTVEVSPVEEPEEQSHDVSSTSDHKLEDFTVDATVANDETSLAEIITENKDVSGEMKKSTLPDVEDSVDDKKVNDVENVESNENNENEETTDTTRVKETSVESVTTEISVKIVDKNDKENNENESKENNESEIKENDENENKENDENENKENNESNEINESENKENDENENKENDESEKRNESNAEILNNVEESSVVTAETREKRDDQSEIPDSTPSEERKIKSVEPLEKSFTEKVEAEREPVNGKEDNRVDGTPVIDETPNINKKSEASSETDSKNVVANSVESDESKVDDASATREETSEETEQIDEAEVAKAGEVIDSTTEREKKEEEEDESPRNEEDKEDKEWPKNEEKDKGKKAETLGNEEANEEAETLGNKEDKEEETEQLTNKEDKEREKSPTNTEDKGEEKSLGNTEDEERNRSPRDETREENSRKTPISVESGHAIVVTEILREVFDLASAEVKKRLENENLNDEKCSTDETLENISLEIQNSADMPALELDEQAASNKKS